MIRARFIPALAALVFAAAQLGCLSASPAPTEDQDAGGQAVDAGQADAGDFERVRVATFNTHRFFDTVCQTGACGPDDYEALPSQEAFDAQADQLAGALRTFDANVVMLQEVETQASLDALTARVGDVLPNAVLGEIGTPGSVDVALMTSGEITQVIHHRDTLIRPDGSQTLFSRQLLEVHITLGGKKVVAFAAHFRSKVSDDPGRRLAEAQKAHELVLAAAQAEPDALVVLGGDLNDVPGSPPLEALEGDGALLRVASDLPAAAQATYLFHGTGEAIDHILVAVPGGGAYLPGTAHVLPGSPGYAGSDHDPLLADFALPR